jgi:hypothetical protein
MHKALTHTHMARRPHSQLSAQPPLAVPHGQHFIDPTRKRTNNTRVAASAKASPCTLFTERGCHADAQTLSKVGPALRKQHTRPGTHGSHLGTQCTPLCHTPRSQHCTRCTARRHPSTCQGRQAGRPL